MLCTILTCDNSFEQISDEKKDLKPLLEAEKQINFFIDKYPNTDYANDLRFKKNLIQNQLAARIIYCKILYFNSKMGTINRLKEIIKKYDKTIFVEEAYID